MPGSSSHTEGVLVVSVLEELAEQIRRVLAGRIPVNHLRSCTEACDFLASHPGQEIVISTFQAWKPESYGRLIEEFPRVRRIDVVPCRTESDSAEPATGRGHFAVLSLTATDLEFLHIVELARGSSHPFDAAMIAKPPRQGESGYEEAPAPLPEELLLMVAHNVRSMAATIHGFAGLPISHNASAASAAEPVLSRVRSVSERLIVMVDDLTHALLLGSGQDQVKSDRVVPAELVEAAYLDVRWAAEARQQQIERRIQVSGAPRLVNRPCLQMALRNVLDNAIKYSPTGSTIVLVASGASGWLTFRVSDSGPGIPPGRVGTLFRRPSSVDFRRVQHGMGLGLWITKRVAEWHGGDVHAESTPGGGTTFVLRVWAAYAGSEAPLTVQPPSV